MGKLLIVFRSHWKWGWFQRVPGDPGEHGQWQSSAWASTIDHLLWYPANRKLGMDGRKSSVVAIDPHQRNMELPHVLSSTIHCHPPPVSPPHCLQKQPWDGCPRVSENLADAAAAGSWCHVALPELLSTMCSFSNKGEKPPFVSRAGNLTAKQSVYCENDPFPHPQERKSPNTRKEEIFSERPSR